jgi:regulator of extracellular matrix RemA (YlzA/DUF370 family)
LIGHIGSDSCVVSDEVIAVLTHECAQARDTQAMLRRVRSEGRLTASSEGERSYLLLCGGGEETETVHVSAINTQTLHKRFLAHGLYDINREGQLIVLKERNA